MYGMVHRAVQCFAQDTYGEAVWDQVVSDADLPFHDFEAMFAYPDACLDDVLKALASRLGTTQVQMTEDVGAYLVSHPRMDSVRRLLRFGGATFEEFIMSLDDLNDRVKLALPDLDLPRLEVEVFSKTDFNILVHFARPGFGAVLLGILRAMADDYGALAVLERSDALREDGHTEQVRVELFEVDFSVGRDFGLVAEHVAK